MILRPAHLKEIQDALSAASRKGVRVSGVDLGALNRVLEYSPEDMTVTAEAGLGLVDLQRQLAERGQWLPLDPPQPKPVTLEEVLSENLSGPRQFGLGTARDHLIGIKVALADGRVIKAGGRVVKNVAGYDLCKLFVGSRRTLGIIVEATFKLRPIPEEEVFLQTRFDALKGAEGFLDRILESELTPVVLDLHNLGQSDGSHAGEPTVVIGFAGAREDVAHQKGLAIALGATTECNLDHESRFWSDPTPAAHRHSVLPSRLVELIQGLGDSRYVARAGDGILWHRGGVAPEGAGPVWELGQRLRRAYDPNGVFAEFSL
ncbi:MAG: FAD-binding oxidoreductase [Verrucomicrobia bacterium]|nr:FAD-binding oxidoreductase [Verrucomicrobiota bacterium]